MRGIAKVTIKGRVATNPEPYDDDHMSFFLELKRKDEDVTHEWWMKIPNEICYPSIREGIFLEVIGELRKDKMVDENGLRRPWSFVYVDQTYELEGEEHENHVEFEGIVLVKDDDVYTERKKARKVLFLVNDPDDITVCCMVWKKFSLKLIHYDTFKVVGSLECYEVNGVLLYTVSVQKINAV